MYNRWPHFYISMIYFSTIIKTVAFRNSSHGVFLMSVVSVWNHTGSHKISFIVSIFHYVFLSRVSKQPCPRALTTHPDGEERPEQTGTTHDRLLTTRLHTGTQPKTPILLGLAQIQSCPMQYVWYPNNRHIVLCTTVSRHTRLMPHRGIFQHNKTWYYFYNFLDIIPEIYVSAGQYWQRLGSMTSIQNLQIECLRLVILMASKCVNRRIYFTYMTTNQSWV
jgi:hypothetical protein